MHMQTSYKMYRHWTINNQNHKAYYYTELGVKNNCRESINHSKLRITFSLERDLSKYFVEKEVKSLIALTIKKKKKKIVWNTNYF